MKKIVEELNAIEMVSKVNEIAFRLARRALELACDEDEEEVRAFIAEAIREEANKMTTK